MWVIQLTLYPTPERLAARPAHRHRLALLHEQGIVRMAGPFDDDSGALIILDVDTRQDVENLMSKDPYFATPGVKIASVSCWRPFIT